MSRPAHTTSARRGLRCSNTGRWVLDRRVRDELPAATTLWQPGLFPRRHTMRRGASTRPACGSLTIMAEKVPIYPRVNGQPQMRESVVLWLDILGYQAMIRGADDLEKQETMLAALHRALKRHRSCLTPKLKGGQSRFAVRAFTDNIVIGRPIFGDGESDLGRMITNSGEYQLALAREGFFVRGAITIGPHYMDQYAVFGPALVEAYDIESKRAVYPRIVLSESARVLVKHHVGYYAGGAINSPHDSEILIDDDGEWFVNYLDAARLDNDPELLPGYERLVRRHRRRLRAKILAHQRDRRVLEKYLWTGRYHNFVCGYLYPGRADLKIPGKLLKQSFRRLHVELPPK